MKRFRLQRFLALALILAFAVSVRTATAQDGADMSAKEIINANIEATGGLKAWRSVKDLSVVAEIGIELPGMGALLINLESINIFPGYGYTSIEVAEAPAAIPAEQINQKAYYTPLEGWVEGAAGRQDMNSLSPQQRTQFQRSSPKNELDYLAYADSMLIRLDDRDLEGKSVFAIDVVTDGVSSTMLYDKESFLMVAQEAETPAGPAITYMSEFMEVDGLMFPGKTSVNMGGQNQVITFKSIEVNSSVTPSSLATKAGVKKMVAPE
ncbi:MAG: hypothetical protein HOC28_01270 [Bacteroidetes Order II. Incertae sedis bacterium]|jgi:hypothetical protein|nr:hypothetical protein [Bacteroidetes Order II. bacterium]MBT4601742.1 hypothetical protein [Bacteroidetes Order II. bacterium]MBT5250677.1 hypothetical protein [Bacteroidetes Order II. bacterium]MBT6201995.1 hypothetical protein [Bacteroidetes Order II. bacterium]MBT6425770.1 hypothetical protein [Bacteroidetes Order II. bacterium]